MLNANNMLLTPEMLGKVVEETKASLASRYGDKSLELESYLRWWMGPEQMAITDNLLGLLNPSVLSVESDVKVDFLAKPMTRTLLTYPIDLEFWLQRDVILLRCHLPGVEAKTLHGITNLAIPLI